MVVIRNCKDVLKGMPFLFQQGSSIKLSLFVFFFVFFFTAPVSKGVDDDLSAYIPGKIGISF